MAALLASAGNSVARCVAGTAAVLAGQLSIGWSNDLIDRDRDRRSGRSDKPLATRSEPGDGTAFAGLVRSAVIVALGLTLVLSTLLGWAAALLHYAAVSCGWLYNLGLKSRIISPLPYLLAFGSLPSIATLALHQPRLAPAWAMLAAGLLGVAAHFGNVVPDISDDLATGVLGLPQRVGSFGSVLTAVAAILLATVTIVVAGPTVHPAVSLAGVVVVTLLAAAALVAARRRSGDEFAFGATMAAAAVDVVILAANHGLR